MTASPLHSSLPAWLALTLVLTTPLARADHSPYLLANQPAPACQFEPLGAHPSAGVEPKANAVRYVDFWASWCLPCAKAFPFMQDLHARYAGQGLEIVAISVDETLEEAEGFLAKHATDFALGLDSKGNCPRAYQITGMPTSFLIDRAGVIRYVHTGFRSGDAKQIEDEIKTLLANP